MANGAIILTAHQANMLMRITNKSCTTSKQAFDALLGLVNTIDQVLYPEFYAMHIFDSICFYPHHPHMIASNIGHPKLRKLVVTRLAETEPDRQVVNDTHEAQQPRGFKWL